MASRFKIKRRDSLLLAVFHALVGILQLAALVLIDARMVWMGALAILSLIAAYSLFTVKKWSVWLVISLFFVQVVFGGWTLYSLVSPLYSSFLADTTVLLLGVSLGAFIVLSFASFVYVAAKRKSFEAD